MNSTNSLEKSLTSETSTTHSVQRANLVEKYELGWIFEKGLKHNDHAVAVSSVIENKGEQQSLPPPNNINNTSSEHSEPEIVTEEQVIEAEEEYAAGVKQKIQLFEGNNNNTETSKQTFLP